MAFPGFSTWENFRVFLSILQSQFFKYSLKFLKAYEAAINLFEDDLALNWESVLRTEYGDVTKAEAMKRVFMQPWKKYSINCKWWRLFVRPGINFINSLTHFHFFYFKIHKVSPSIGTPMYRYSHNLGTDSEVMVWNDCSQGKRLVILYQSQLIRI